MSCLSSIGMMRAGVAAPATLALGLPSLAGPVGVKHNKVSSGNWLLHHLKCVDSVPNDHGRHAPRAWRHSCVTLCSPTSPGRKAPSRGGRAGCTSCPSPGQGSRAEARSLSPGPPAGGCSPMPSLCGPHTEGLAGPGSAPCAHAATLPGDKCRNTRGKLYVTIHSPRAAADNRGSAKTPCSLHT